MNTYMNIYAFTCESDGFKKAKIVMAESEEEAKVVAGISDGIMNRFDIKLQKLVEVTDDFAEVIYNNF